MPLVGCKQRFVAPILAGTKDQTIRAPRKVPIKLHTVLHLYTGLRRPGAKLIARVLCTSIYRIEMAPAEKGGWVNLWMEEPADAIPGESLFAHYSTSGPAPHACDDFAVRDGFASWADLCAFWREEHGELVEPFRGHVYRWDPRSIPR